MTLDELREIAAEAKYKPQEAEDLYIAYIDRLLNVVEAAQAVCVLANVPGAALPVDLGKRLCELDIQLAAVLANNDHRVPIFCECRECGLLVNTKGEHLAGLIPDHEAQLEESPLLWRTEGEWEEYPGRS